MAHERSDLPGRVLPQMTLDPGSQALWPLRPAFSFKLSDNATVTSSARNLGFTVSKILLEHKAKAKVSVPSAKFLDVSVPFQNIDITDEAAVDYTAAETVALLGPLTTLLNFAGMDRSKDWSHIMSADTIGAFFVAREMAINMIVHKTGSRWFSSRAFSAHQKSIFPSEYSISPRHTDTILNEDNGLEEERNIWLAPIIEVDRTANELSNGRGQTLFM
ncbi:hypothetical protein F4803DRAFT_563551 [Xylaria telfairii]|nr:hypothetical protein F4803DRAFT_563551 [Xylaria telfairii]